MYGCIVRTLACFGFRQLCVCVFWIIILFAGRRTLVLSYFLSIYVVNWVCWCYFLFAPFNSLLCTSWTHRLVMFCALHTFFIVPLIVNAIGNLWAKDFEIHQRIKNRKSKITFSVTLENYKVEYLIKQPFHHGRIGKIWLNVHSNSRFAHFFLSSPTHFAWCTKHLCECAWAQAYISKFIMSSDQNWICICNRTKWSRTHIERQHCTVCGY